jgi:predicted nuclease of predicted toxin-antitoxin system
VTVRVLANENFPRASVLVARNAGLDVLSVTEVMRGATDRAVLQFAVDEGLWIVTLDRDYGELVFAGKVACPPAIIYFRQGAYAPTWPGERLCELAATPELALGHLVVVMEGSIRRRPLPFPASPHQ